MPNNWKDLRIVFMGTPDFAVSSLDALVRAGATIVGVVTAPDKPAGRGLALQESAVKKYAVEHDLHLLQPEKLKNPGFLDALAECKADVQVVVAFRMLPEVVWNSPPLGTINVHASLLPRYRGAAPINWAIINGETETGVTTFLLRQEIDTGNILLQDRVPIGPTMTAGELYDVLKEKGAALLVKTLEELSTLKGQPQPAMPEESLPHAPKIVTETCKIDWNLPIDRIYNLIRGLSPYPAAFTELDGKILKIFTGEKEASKEPGSPGGVMTDGKTYLKFAGADGDVRVLDLQLEGKKRMKVTDFLRGYRLKS